MGLEWLEEGPASVGLLYLEYLNHGGKGKHRLFDPFKYEVLATDKCSTLA